MLVYRIDGVAEVCPARIFLTPLELAAVRRSLARGRELLADPAHWTRDMLAEDGRGRPCNPRAERACRWCALGAVAAQPYRYRRTFLHCGDASYTATQVLHLAAYRRYGKTMVQVNDGPEFGHQDVLACYDEALRLLDGAEREPDAA